MSGTKAGGKAAAATNKAKYGTDFYAQIGASGGAASKGYRFGHGKVNPAEIGKKGGLISTRLGVKNGAGKKRNV